MNLLEKLKNNQLISSLQYYILSHIYMLYENVKYDHSRNYRASEHPQRTKRFGFICIQKYGDILKVICGWKCSTRLEQ